MESSPGGTIVRQYPALRACRARAPCSAPKQKRGGYGKRRREAYRHYATYAQHHPVNFGGASAAVRGGAMTKWVEATSAFTSRGASG
jgi:hypothetical protein